MTRWLLWANGETRGRTLGGKKHKGSLGLEEGAREVVWIEWPQVVQLLADADQLHRQAELVRDRHGDAALRGAVELRQRHTADLDGLAEEARLLEAVLPGGRVDHEQRLVRRAFEALPDDAVHLGELVHQVRLGVQPTGGVDDDHVAASRLRRLDRVVGDRGRVSPALRADEVRACAPGPDLDLLLRRRAEGVARRDEHRVAVLGEPSRELADRRRLARAVDADDEDQAGTPVEFEAPGVAEHRGDLLLQRNA